MAADWGFRQHCYMFVLVILQKLIDELVLLQLLHIQPVLVTQQLPQNGCTGQFSNSNIICKKQKSKLNVKLIMFFFF